MIKFFCFLAGTVSYVRPSDYGAVAFPFKLYKRAVPLGSGKNTDPR